MLNELKKLPPLRVAGELQGNGRRKNFGNKRNATSNSRQQVQQTSNGRRKGATIVKEMNTSTMSTETTATDENEMSNPISVLLRYQQFAKQNEPIYTVIEERGRGRRKEFVMEVSCGDLIGRGIGCSKKLAKRAAAKSVLVQLGLNESGSTDSTAAHDINTTDKNRKVTFSEAKLYNESIGQSAGGAAGRQLVPGILLMKNPENNRSMLNSFMFVQSASLALKLIYNHFEFVSEAKNSQSGINYTTTATIAKELLDAGKSPTAEAMINQSSPVKQQATEEIATVTVEKSPSKLEPNNNNIGETTKPTTHAVYQLLYLADLLKFEVKFLV